MSPFPGSITYAAAMLPDGDCLTAQVVCCTSLYDIAYHILAEVHKDLVQCHEPSPCSPGWITYVTMGDGDDAVMDALSVSVVNVRPSPNSQTGGKLSPASAFLADFRVRILEAGWPMVREENGELFQPDPVEQNALARHAFGHGERMYRTLISKIANGQIVPNGMNCMSPVLGPLTPIKPAGGTVGWRADVTLTLTWGGG